MELIDAGANVWAKAKRADRPAIATILQSSKDDDFDDFVVKLILKLKLDLSLKFSVDGSPHQYQLWQVVSKTALAKLKALEKSKSLKDAFVFNRAQSSSSQHHSQDHSQNP